MFEINYSRLTLSEYGLVDDFLILLILAMTGALFIAYGRGWEMIPDGEILKPDNAEIRPVHIYIGVMLAGMGLLHFTIQYILW